MLYGSYISLVFAAVVVALVLDPSRAKDQRFLILIDGGAKVAALALAALLLRLQKRGGDPGPAPAGRAAVGGAAAALAFLPLMLGTSWLQGRVLEAMGWDPSPQTLVDVAVKGSDADFLLILVFAVVLAPIFEEMVFRVHLYSGLRPWMGPAGAALLSATAFSLSHLQPVAFAITFLLGLALAAVREKTGGRSAPIAMHACYNAVQMAGILAMRAGA